MKDIEFLFRTITWKVRLFNVHTAAFPYVIFLFDIDNWLLLSAVTEERFLKTINIEEQFGGKTYQSSKAKEDKKKSKASKTAIGFNYSDSAPPAPAPPPPAAEPEDDGGSDSDDSEIDLDMNINMMVMSVDQRDDINKTGKTFGLGKEDFIKYLAVDVEEAEAMRHAKEKESEKAMYSVSKACLVLNHKHETCWQPYNFRAASHVVNEE